MINLFKSNYLCYLKRISSLKSFFTFSAAIIFSIVSLAQPSIQWQKSFGGSYDDEALSIQQTNDDGFIIGGYTFSNDSDITGNHGGYDYWLVKLNVNGLIQWQKTLGGTQNDKANFVQQTVDGGFIAAGYSYSNDGDVTGHHNVTAVSDYWIVKLDTAGNIQWEKSLGGASEDRAYSIEQTNDKGYVVAGFANSNNDDVSGNHGNDDYWVVKLDSAGGIQWQKALGGSMQDWAQSVRQTVDGGYVVAGFSKSNDGDVSGHRGDTYHEDYWIVKLDSEGALLWQKSLGGTGFDGANSIQQATDGGYIVAGYALSNDGDVTSHHGLTTFGDYWIVKLNSSGTIQWQKSLGGQFDEEAFSIQQTSDAGYIIAGSSSSDDGNVTVNHGALDYWIVKVDSTGSIKWQKSLGGTNTDWAFSIQPTVDGGCVVAGASNSSDGDITSNYGNYDYWIIKLSALTATEEVNKNNTAYKIFPDPTSEKITIENSIHNIKTIEIANAFGQKIFSQVYGNNQPLATIDISLLSPGIFFVTITNENLQTVMAKFVKVK